MNSNFTRKFETRLVLTALVLAALFVTVYTSDIPLYGQESEGVWVLTDVIDHDAAEAVKNANKKYEGVYHYEVNYSRGSFTHKRTYTGKTESRSPYSDAVHGEFMTLKAEWSSPPNIMKPDEKYPLDFYLGVLEDNSSFYNTGTYAATSLNGTKLENSYVKLNSKTNWRPTDETLILEPPEGRVEGQKLKLSLYMQSVDSLRTIYIYEWMKASEASKVEDVAPYEKPGQEKPEQDTPPARELDYEVPKDENGNYIDSGIRFSNLHGEVMIRRGDDPIGWEFAQLDMVIYEGDRIRTEHNSGVEITLSDLTTFKMKPESEIIVNTASEKENKIKMLAGKVWTNVKQMVTEGTMDVEMSQAVAGIKGTTFIVEETGSESILKVIEGEVELETNTGDKVLVADGAMATVKEGGPARVEPFSINEEINSWDQPNQAWETTEDDKNAGQGKGDQVYVTTEGDLNPLASDDFRYSVLEGWETVNGTWKNENGRLVQTSNYYKKNDLKGGTYAITGSLSWTNYSVSSRIMSEDNDKIGLVFRYLDPDNFYILSWGKENKELLFTKVVNGEAVDLALKELGYEEGQWYQLQVDVVGNEMSAYIDNKKVFSVTDDDLSRGKAGLYCWGNEGSYFDDFKVEGLQTVGQDTGEQIYITTEGDLYPLASDDFRNSTLQGWGTEHGSWNVENGVLAQTSNYWKGGLKGGTYAFTGSSNWTDYSVSARVMSKDDDTIGLIFRYLNEDNFYIFSWKKQNKELLFTKVANGKTTTLLEKELAYQEEKWYQLQVDVIGNQMSAYIDNKKIFSVTDDDLTRGMAGLYSHGNDASYFDDFSVVEASH